MEEAQRSPRLLRVNLSFGSKHDNVGVRIGKMGSPRFVLVGSLNQTEAAGFMSYVLANYLTDGELEAHARCYGLKAPVR